MTSQSWRLVRACAQYVRYGWLCVGVFSLLATPAFSDTSSVGSYNAWQWNGFSRSSPPAASNAATSTTQESVLASLTYSALANTDDWDGTASLSGFVYVDTDPNDGAMNTADWAIADAKIVLTFEGSTDPLAVYYTGQDGFYHFDNLSAGLYSIAMLTPCSMPGQDQRGTLRDKNGTIDVARTNQVVVQQDLFSNIDLLDSYTGTNYNFAELVYPISLISKRMLVDGNGTIHTTPEPGSLMLLAIAGLFFGGLTTWRCRKIA